MNVKPNDLAMVVSPNVFAGATCTVLERAPQGLEYVVQWGPMWIVRFPRPMPWQAIFDGVDPCEGAIPDNHLRRIAGPDVDVDTRQFNPIEHEAAH